MQLLKQSDLDFSFFKKSTKKKNKHFTILKGITGAFITLQLILVSLQVYDIYNFKNDSQRLNDNYWKIYMQTTEDIKSGDLNKALPSFAQLKHEPFEVGATVASSFILNMNYSLLSRKTADYSKENDMYHKLSEKDVKVLTDFNEKIWDYGAQQENKSMQNYFKCNPLNITCHLFPPLKYLYWDDAYKANMKAHKIKMYNIKHIDEYFMVNQSNMKNLTMNSSPGEIYYKNLKE